jgi:Tol biopolymer transport system component
MLRICLMLAVVTLVVGSSREGPPGRMVLRQGWPEAPSGILAGAVSADSRHVAFVSAASLLPADTNVLDDIYILDRESQRLTLATASYSGAASNGTALNPQLNADGQYLVFNSRATVLTGGPDRNEVDDVFVRDGVSGITTRVSVGHGGLDGNGRSAYPAISGDGRWVVFESDATNLVPGDDTNGTGSDVYLADLATGGLTRIGVDDAGRQFARSFAPRISGNGRFVAFAATPRQSGSSRWHRGAATIPRVYLRDLTTGTTVCVSCDQLRKGARLGAFAPDLNVDGSVVVFAIQSTSARSDIALYERASRATTVITRRANARSASPRLSGDGRVIAFESWASNLLCAGRCRDPDIDENLLPDIYLFDRTKGHLRRASGTGAAWWTPSVAPGIDGTGAVVIFSSREPFGPEDMTADFDLFVCSPVCP